MSTTHSPFAERTGGDAAKGSRVHPGRAPALRYPALQKTHPSSRYSVRDFLRDQRLATAAASSPSSSRQDTVEIEDGRMLLIHTRLLRRPGAAEREIADAFSTKDGSRVGASHLSRLRAVVDYVDERRSEIAWNGLGEDGDPAMIREELLDFLLQYEVDPDQPEIPKFALKRFLVDWGHRRM